MKYRSVYWREGETPPELASNPWSIYSQLRSFTEAAPSYCYRYAMQSVLDDAERVFEGCLPHGDLGEIGTFDESELISREVVNCREPPAGLEEAWCEQSLRACRADNSTPLPPKSDCANVAKRCAPAPEEPAEAEDVDAGASDEASPARRKARMSAARDGGCSAPGGPTSGSPQLLLFLAVLASVALRRRSTAVRAADHAK